MSCAICGGRFASGLAHELDRNAVPAMPSIKLLKPFRFVMASASANEGPSKEVGRDGRSLGSSAKILRGAAPSAQEMRLEGHRFDRVGAGISLADWEDGAGTSVAIASSQP